ncbi:helix-turn-helix domain-containing protein [Clostridium novyi]|uniref:helix-turn-helix domain-containing protein n=1 Tax=Clostridium novyi TaxID=1542 RepID=UPI00069E3B9A|nr:helix-turn-helix transcriptional regulator [Clostridium novyi]
MDIKKIIGERIRQERLATNLNQPELAKKLNVSKGTVSNWENGNRSPDSEMLSKLATFFGVTTDYLLGKTNIRDKTCESIFDGAGTVNSKLSKVSQQHFSKNDNNTDNKTLLEFALNILKQNHIILEKREDKNAAKTLLTILDALIDNNTLNNKNWNEDTMAMLISLIRMYINNKEKTTEQ